MKTEYDGDQEAISVRIWLFFMVLGFVVILCGQCSKWLDPQPAEAQSPHKAFLPMILSGNAPVTTSTTTTVTTSTTTSSTILSSTALVVNPTRSLFNIGQEPDPLRIDLEGSGMQAPMFLYFDGLTYYPIIHVQGPTKAFVLLPRAELIEVMILRGGPFNTVCYAQRGERQSEFFGLAFDP